MADDIPHAAVVAVVTDSGHASLKAYISVGGQNFIGDEPIALGGTGLGPAPHDLVSAALAQCTTLTLRLYADRKGWPLEAIEVRVSHEVQPGVTPQDLFRRELVLTGPLDAAQRARLKEIAERCPVHRTLTAGSRIETTAGA